MKINLTKEEIENFTCDVCGKKLDIFYYQNHWREIKGVCKQCDSMDDSYEFRNIICESCWHKAFPNIKENSKSSKIVAKMNYLTSFNYDDSDSMTDYFDCGFYMHVSIGKYNKPCVVETPKNWKLSDKSKKEVKVA